MVKENKKMAGNPKYVEVYQKLKRDIMSRKYPLNSLLPTENELTELFGVSKITVRHAVQLLKEEHLVSVQQGRGAQVILPQEGVEYSSTRYRNAVAINVRYRADTLGEFNVSPYYVDVIPADVRVSGEMDVPVGTNVIRIQRTHSIGDVVIGYVTHYLQKEMVPELLEKKTFEAEKLYDYMEKVHGKRFVEGSESVNIIAAGFAESKVLDVEVGTPLFFLKRCAYCQCGIMEYCESLFKPNNFEIEVVMRGDD